MDDSNDDMTGLTNLERYYAWRTAQAVSAWHRRDLEECQNIAEDLLWVPLLPLWHRCNLNFYMAGIARLKGKPKHGQFCLRETLRYIAVLKQVDIRNGEVEDAASVDLQSFAERLYGELEADIVYAREKAAITKVIEEESQRAETEFMSKMRSIIRGEKLSGEEPQDSDTDMATQEKAAITKVTEEESQGARTEFMLDLRSIINGTKLGGEDPKDSDTDMATQSSLSGHI